MVDSPIFAALGKLKKRVECGRAYLLAVEKSLQADWLPNYQMYLNGHLRLEESLALAHPDHYRNLSNNLGIRGARAFAQEIRQGETKCLATVWWGYECNLTTGISADHLFPYSLGGPTVGTNKIYLCSLHNQMKSNDVHLFPWEQGEPVWLADTLKSVWRLKATLDSTQS